MLLKMSKREILHLQLFRGSGILPDVNTIVVNEGTEGIIHAIKSVAVAQRQQLKSHIHHIDVVVVVVFLLSIMLCLLLHSI